MDKPRISIIVPTYNSGETISSCIESILNQDYDWKEVIIVDGGSRDSTPALLADFAARYNFIKFKSEKDRGVYDAMNKGIGMASGEWIFFLGSDDSFYASDVLTKVSHCLQTARADMVYGNVQVNGDSSWAEDKTIYDGEFTTEKLLIKNICHQSIFYRKTLFERLGNFNLEYPVCADWDFNLRCFAKCETTYMDLLVANFQGGGLSTQRTTDKFTDVDIILNIRRYFNIAYSHKIFSILFPRMLTLAGIYFRAGRTAHGIYFLFWGLFHSNNKLSNIKHIRKILAKNAG